MVKISIPGKETKKHIAAALILVFPSFKFSLTSDYDSVRVAWVDGPFTQDVQKVLNRFETYTRVMSITDFDRLTGYEWEGVLYVGPKYLNTSRLLSDERKSAIVAYMDEQGDESYMNAMNPGRVKAERDLIAAGMLVGMDPNPNHEPDLMRDSKPEVDERPKKQQQSSLIASCEQTDEKIISSFLTKRAAQISSSEDAVQSFTASDGSDSV